MSKKLEDQLFQAIKGSAESLVESFRWMERVRELTKRLSATDISKKRVLQAAHDDLWNAYTHAFELDTRYQAQIDKLSKLLSKVSPRRDPAWKKSFMARLLKSGNGFVVHSRAIATRRKKVFKICEDELTSLVKHLPDLE